MKRGPEEEGRRWLEQAEADLYSAQVLLDHDIYHTTCFIAQQAAEKALKAYLYAMGEELVTGHSVAALSTWAGKYDAEFFKLQEEISILDTHYIATRYPNGLPDSIPAKVYTQKAAVEAFTLAKKAIQFVKSKLQR